MSYYNKGLETPCKADIIVPITDTEESILSSVDNVRKFSSRAARTPGIISNVHRAANFLGGNKHSWRNYFRSGC